MNADSGRKPGGTVRRKRLAPGNPDRLETSPPTPRAALGARTGAFCPAPYVRQPPGRNNAPAAKAVRGLPLLLAELGQVHVWREVRTPPGFRDHQLGCGPEGRDQGVRAIEGSAHDVAAIRIKPPGQQHSGRVEERFLGVIEDQLAVMPQG
jgi:hypothetical protein